MKIPRTNGVWENPEKAGNCKWIPDKNFRPKPKTMCNGAVYNNPNNLSWEEILKPYGTDGIRYVNCIPDLSPFSYASVQLDYAKILRGKEHLPNHKIREIIQEEAYKQMQKDKQLIAKIKKEGFASVKEYKEAKNLVCHELPDGRVLLVDRQIHDNIPSHLGGVATSKTLLMKTETKSIANKEIEDFTIAMTKELKGKNASTIKQILASSKGGRHAIEENVNNLVLRDEQLIGKYAQRYNMESARQAKLLSEMQNDKDLALLIRANPEYNILRWNNTLKKVDRTALSKYARNTQYAGKPFYFHPSLNRNIQNYLAQKGTFKGYTQEMLLELDKLFPNGVPYTKEGFPDFIKANVCKLDNHGEVIKVLMPSGHFSISREQDFAVARMVARKKYGSINEFGYIWHHLEGEPAAMVLVKTECHEICSHTGGHALERMHIENAARRLTNPINLSATVKIPYKIAN